MQRSFARSVRPLITDTIINNPDNVDKDATEYVEKKDNCDGYADAPLRILDTSIVIVSPKKMPRQHDAGILTPSPPPNKRHKANNFSAAAAAQYANVLEAFGNNYVEMTS